MYTRNVELRSLRKACITDSLCVSVLDADSERRAGTKLVRSVNRFYMKMQTERGPRTKMLERRGSKYWLAQWLHVAV